MLPEDVVDKIAELDLELSEGDITQKGDIEQWCILWYLESWKIEDVKFFGLDIVTLVSQFHFRRLREEEEQTSRTILKTNTAQSNHPSSLTTG